MSDCTHSSNDTEHSMSMTATDLAEAGTRIDDIAPGAAATPDAAAGDAPTVDPA